MTTAVAQAVSAGVIPRADAVRLDKRIRLLVGQTRDNIEKLYQLVGEAKAGQIHESLEYASWPAYVADVFKVEWKIDREERRELVAFLHGEGMSQRAIADVVDVGVGTVNRDLGDAAPVPNGTPDLTEAEAFEVTASIRGWVDAGRQIGLSDTEIQDVSSAAHGERPTTTGKDGKQYARSEPKPKPKTPELDPADYVNPFCSGGDEFPGVLKILKTVYKNSTYDLTLNQIQQVEDFLERSIRALKRRKTEIEKYAETTGSSS